MDPRVGSTFKKNTDHQITAASPRTLISYCTGNNYHLPTEANKNCMNATAADEIKEPNSGFR